VQSPLEVWRGSHVPLQMEFMQNSFFELRSCEEMVLPQAAAPCWWLLLINRAAHVIWLSDFFAR
jgi:hypothetical protein